jgi:CPA2 family monovalent cation:H+ antiporter-2
MASPLLTDLLIIFGLSIPIVYTFARLKIAPLVGFLLAGILAGPFGLQVVQDIGNIDILAEIGVVLLLFTIGMEFSLRELIQLRRIVLLGGSLQITITTVVVALILFWLGSSRETSIFLGLLVALSSTAIVLKLLQEKGEIYSLHGRTSLGILIFQDIAAVIIILLIPLLAGTSGTDKSFLELILQGIGLIILTILSARYVVPFIMYQVAKTRNNELFLLSIIVIGLSVAWLTSIAGLSLALGAFLAGLIIAESEYSVQALGNLIPFRDLFMSVFFISIGMMLDLNILREHLYLVLAVTLAILVLKIIINALSTFLIGFSLHTMILVGFALSQVGEFSLILAKEGLTNGLISPIVYQEFLDVAVISMVLTPFIINIGYRATNYTQAFPLPAIIKSGWYKLFNENNPQDELENHVIIIGLGINGRNVVIAAKAASIPYYVIEANPEVVRKEKMKGEPVLYGDAAQKAVLEHAGIKNAKTIVVSAGDPASAKRIIEAARRLNPQVHIIARTHFLSELDKFYAFGADEVISDEFESSIELFTRVLHKYLVPRSEISSLSSTFRADHYKVLRNQEIPKKRICDLALDFAEVEIRSIRVGKFSRAAGKSLGELNLRQIYGVSVLAFSREHKIIPGVQAETKILPDDLLLVISPPEKLDEVRALLEGNME